MGSKIHVEESELAALKKVLEDAGEQYKSNLARLTNLIDEITSGDIQGDVADDLKAKFEAKRSDFDALTKEIEKAQEYTGAKGTAFTQMVTDLKDTMK